MALDEPAELTPGPPAAILEDGVAQVAREFGNRSPGVRIARRDGARNAALLCGVAPVFGRYPSSRGDVVREGDVACGVDVRRRRVHAFVDENPAAFGGETGRRGESAVGAYPGSRHHQLGLHRRTVVQCDVTVIDRGHTRPADEPNAIVGQYLCHLLTDVEAEAAVHGYR